MYLSTIWILGRFVDIIPLIMSKYISIDIGSENIKILLVSKSENDSSFKILAKSSYPGAGVKSGYISNQKEFLDSFQKAIAKFESNHRIKIDEAFFSLDGYGIRGEKISTGQPIAAESIAEYDLEKMEEKALALLRRINNDEIIEKQNIKYIIDGFEHFDSPLGLAGKKLHGEYLFITKPKNNLNILEDSIAKTKVLPISFSPAMLASAQSTLSELDKKLGCALVDFGAEKTSIVIYENNRPIHYHIIKKGSSDITKKISIEEKIDFAKAEKLKKALKFEKKVEKIIKKELEDLAKKVSQEIKKAEQENILPGGVTLVGGGSKIVGIEDIFKKELSLPIKKASKSIGDQVTDYHIAYGNIILGLQEEIQESKFKLPKLSSVGKFFKNTFKKLIP